MLLTCYHALGDRENAIRVAQIGAARAEKAVGAYGLAAMGDGPRAKEWISRALMFDPDNLSMRYNLACAQAVFPGDAEGALETLKTYFENANPTQLQHSQVDPDMDGLRGEPRYQAMTEAALARLGMA